MTLFPRHQYQKYCKQWKLYLPDSEAQPLDHFFKKVCNEPQATKFGITIGPLPPSFPYLLTLSAATILLGWCSKVKYGERPSLPCFYYFFLMFHYCSCLISVLVSLQNYSSLSFGRYPYAYDRYPFNGKRYGRIVRHYPKSKISNENLNRQANSDTKSLTQFERIFVKREHWPEID